MLRSDRQAKLMKLLKIDDSYVKSRGLHLDENEEDVMDSEDLIPAKFNIEKKKNLKPPQKITHFRRKKRRNDSDDTIPGPNEFLPSIPFAIYLLGCVKAGKSTLAWDIIDLYKDSFDEILFISPTCKLDPTAIAMIEALKIKKVYKSLQVLKTYMKQIEKTNKNKPHKERIKTLVIMDDCVNQVRKICRKDGNFLVDLAFNRRHYSISFCMMSQYFKKVPAEFRSNFSTYALFRTENQTERKKIVEELSGFLGNDIFEDMFQKATTEPFSCLTINYGSDHLHQYTKNFNEILLNNNNLEPIKEVVVEKTEEVEEEKTEEVEEKPIEKTKQD